MSAVGILSFGSYLPRRRIPRSAIVEANAWFAGGNTGSAAGERAFAGWDEDAVTMAVEAARCCLAGEERSAIRACLLASTTLPFDDRLNAGIAASALDLDDEVAALDLGGSQRAATSALSCALDMAAASGGRILLAGAELRQSRAASAQELTFGDGAAALVVGEGEPVARCVARRTLTTDFVDHYRASGEAFDYGWEDRWVRDEGVVKLFSRAATATLRDAGRTMSEVAFACLPGPLLRAASLLGKSCGLPATAVDSTLQARCGDAGAAQPLLAFAHALERARPGDLVLVAGWGQGCDILLFEALPALAEARPRRRVDDWADDRLAVDNYVQFLALRGLLPLDHGKRAEVDKATPLSALYRNRRMLHGLVGGRCRNCATPQFPKMRVCVVPNCGAVDSQDDYAFAERPARIRSYTSDWQTYCPDPPQMFGMVAFENGGRMMVDFTDMEPGAAEVDAPVRMVFRVKDRDPVRKFVRYFWKAAPAFSTVG